MPATVWKGSISFGLVTFPVRLHTAARPKAVHFHLLHKKDLSRVKEVWYCAEEDKPITRDDMVRGYETSKGKYVVVEDDELAKIAPPTAATMDVLQFVNAGAVDPLLFEKSYYIAAESAAAKAYTLFAAALAQTKQHAIAKMAMHNREHVVLLRASEGGLLLHTLYFADELNRTNRAESPKARYTEKELAMAKTLVEQLKAPFQLSEFHDEYRANVEKMIAQKRKGKQVTAAAQPEKEKIVDIMEALKRSLASVKPAPKAKKRPGKRARAA